MAHAKQFTSNSIYIPTFNDTPICRCDTECEASKFFLQADLSLR